MVRTALYGGSMDHLGQVDAGLLRRHVEALAGGPRGRRHAPGAMERAEEYVGEALRGAGWEVFREPFDVRVRVGSTDRHGQRAMPLKVRVHRGLSGANLRAELPGAAGAVSSGAPTLV
ncbi:MAG: hypothetical protein QOF98_2484, partial [Streptomyces sp.]|nr:hypothetical protein [Streptomyces sp.]